MQIKNLSDGRIMQTAFVTDDIEKAVRAFGREYDIGGWAIIRKVGFESLTLRGKQCDAEIRAAVAFQGDMMYEFIQPMDEKPSVYRDPATNELMLGFHHFARLVTDLPAAVDHYSAMGMSVAMDGTIASGGRAIYMEGGDPKTGMIELFESNPAVDAFINGTAALEAPLTNGDVSITYW